MGTWIIHIEGHGIHDNGVGNDADNLSKQFVEKLREVGHEAKGTFTLTGQTRPL